MARRRWGKVGVKERTQFVRATLGPGPVQSPLNGNSSPRLHIQPGALEPSSINDHFVSWQPHFCSPCPQDHSPGQSALEDSLERTFKHSYFEPSWVECLPG
ncbi:unnamed protein product [Rangifer tarandus platyrhynchus]|uniref:Uncharacterized protein n=6 Tax=Rangifer tarandus platyrhynchus TaxID=3082113 RepID=A0ABN8XLG1_RANTA|nr:unnamed protein product [Rangifer tarandus platyrhynchus]CAI9163460.1 unnamed protein product [Rangifer tarandus platyrhynchus]CAI9163461.1 unnamed protein product [Rangifer tarandus platyrhynchus]CAI9163464.1 unnamed protein product [Rangifer tarandus platyrhynchus]